MTTAAALVHELMEARDERRLLTRVPKRAQPGVATMVRTIYQQLLIDDN